MPEPKTTEGQSTCLPAAEKRWIPDPPDQVRGRDDGEWRKALAGFEAAQAEVLRIEAATSGCGFEDEEALLPAHDAACEAMEAALRRMLFVPAPHLFALGIKFEAAFAQELRSAPEDDPRFGTLLADIGRLSGAECLAGPSRRRFGGLTGSSG
ncbi:MAG TPA: hypothetical protein VF759_04600 [Allosphingosinicella sp.]